MAFTLVAAHGAEALLSGAIGFPNRTSNLPTQADNCFFKDLKEEQKQPVVLILHESNNGAKFTIPSGTVVKVILMSHVASDGFDWTLTSSLPNIVAFQNKRIQQAPSHLMGAPAKECWLFTAMTPGETTLTFSLTRSWEKDTAPGKTIYFDINVE